MTDRLDDIRAQRAAAHAHVERHGFLHDATKPGLDDIDGLLDRLAAAEDPAAAAEARLEAMATNGRSAFWDDLRRELQDPEFRAHFERVSTEIAAADHDDK